MANKNGKPGEDHACKYLLENGFEIIDRNFYMKGGEIDIIARKDNVVHFIEVKTRSKSYSLEEFELVTQIKIKRMKKAINKWFELENIEEPFWQIDFIAIILSLDSKLRSVDLVEDVSF